MIELFNALSRMHCCLPGLINSINEVTYLTTIIYWSGLSCIVKERSFIQNVSTTTRE